MKFKDEAKSVINALPNNATVDDAIHALYVAAKFEHGISQISHGKGVSHSKAIKRFAKWLK